MSVQLHGTIRRLVRFALMQENHVFDTPSEVSAEDGVVKVDGPDGVDVSLTPDAAVETSNRLLEEAMKAGGQRHFGAKP